MKTLVVSTGLMAVLFLSASSNIEAQKRRVNKPKPASKTVSTEKEIPKPTPTNSPLATEKKLASDTVTQAMVKAVKDNQIDLFSSVTLEGDEKTAYGNAYWKAVDTALLTTGESLDQFQRLTLAVIFDHFFKSRRPLTPEKVADYLTRFVPSTKPQSKSGELLKARATIQPTL
jgi:hypothetical protein